MSDPRFLSTNASDNDVASRWTKGIKILRVSLCRYEAHQPSGWGFLTCCSETGPTPHLNAQRVGDAEHPEIDMDSQTQDETQYPLALVAGNANSAAAELKKRSLSHETVRNSKKMKISVGEGVDLED